MNMLEQKSAKRLGVNIDHVATLREARGTVYPEPIEVAKIALKAGADGITIHLREDRRHIQEEDLKAIRELINCDLNLEMAVCEEMLGLAQKYKPDYVCLVPEKREELTTEGGLDVISSLPKISSACERLKKHNIPVSLFIDPDKGQIDAALLSGATAIELHTGTYADAKNNEAQSVELLKISDMAKYGKSKGLIVNAGHGLHLGNVKSIAAIKEIYELNIGHSVIARALFVGIESAVQEMKDLMS